MMPETEALLEIAATTTLTDEEWDVIVHTELTERFAGRVGASRGELLWTIANELADRRQRIQALEAGIRRYRAKDIAENGPARFGDTFITVAPDNKRRIQNTDALLAWLEEAGTELDVDNLALQVFRISDSNLRIGTLRRVAERLYQHTNPHIDDEEKVADYVRTIEDTFLDIERGDPVLKEIPIDRAPKYAQKLEHGHRAGSFANKEGKST